MTGAMIAAGADAVVMVERTGGRLESVAVPTQLPAGRSIRPRGGRPMREPVVIPSGTLVDPGSFAAATGHARLTVRPRHASSSLSTGRRTDTPGAVAPGRSGQNADDRRLRRGSAARSSMSGVGGDQALIRDVDDADASADVVVDRRGVEMGPTTWSRPPCATTGSRYRPGRDAAGEATGDSGCSLGRGGFGLRAAAARSRHSCRSRCSWRRRSNDDGAARTALGSSPGSWGMRWPLRGRTQIAGGDNAR